MPGFGVTSTKRDTLPPGAAATSIGAAAIAACLDPCCSPLNWRLGAACAKIVVENRTMPMNVRMKQIIEETGRMNREIEKRESGDRRSGDRRSDRVNRRSR